MAFSLESINNFLSTIIRERWIKKYGNDPVIDAIENPMDWTQFVSQMLLMDNVSITRTENGYIIDEDDLQEILDDAEGDEVLMKQILQFKENLKFYDIHIDVNDLATAVGYANIKKGADTIMSNIDAKHQMKLKAFNDAPRINIQNSSRGQMGALSKSTEMGALSKSTQSVILDPNVRGSKAIRSDRRYFHIEAFYPLLEKLKDSQPKQTNGGGTYDVKPYFDYVVKVMDFSKDLSKFIAIKTACYISKYKTNVIQKRNNTISDIRTLMLENDRKWDERHKQICDKLDISIAEHKVTHSKLDKVNTKLNRVVENEVHKRCIIVCRKESWHARRYRVIGRLANDKLIKDLLKQRDNYEIFEYYENINNPAKIKTDIISYYKDNGWITKDKIEDDGLEVNVIRLTSKKYKEFTDELKNKDSDYDIIDDRSS